MSAIDIHGALSRVLEDAKQQRENCLRASGLPGWSGLDDIALVERVVNDGVAILAIEDAIGEVES